MDFKDKAGSLQAIITSIAILIGGGWTVWVYGIQRHAYPQGQVEIRMSHLPINRDPRLLRVEVEVHNTGASRLDVWLIETRVQQVLPVIACADASVELDSLIDESGARCLTLELGRALRFPERCDDRFTWPLLGTRWWVPVGVEEGLARVIEPGQRMFFDMEFAVPAEVETVLISSAVTIDKGEYAKALAAIRGKAAPKAKEANSAADTTVKNECRWAPPVSNAEAGKAPAAKKDNEESTNVLPKALIRTVQYNLSGVLP